MHQIQLRQILRDADVACAIFPIVRKHLLSVEQIADALVACGVDRPTNVAQLVMAKRVSPRNDEKTLLPVTH